MPHLSRDTLRNDLPHRHQVYAMNIASPTCPKSRLGIPKGMVPDFALRKRLYQLIAGSIHVFHSLRGGQHRSGTTSDAGHRQSIFTGGIDRAQIRSIPANSTTAAELRASSTHANTFPHYSMNRWSGSDNQNARNIGIFYSTVRSMLQGLAKWAASTL